MGKGVRGKESQGCGEEKQKQIQVKEVKFRPGTEEGIIRSNCAT